jgi:hypothetical protein
MSKTPKSDYSEAEAQRRFEQALKGASAAKKAKPPARKRKRPGDQRGGKSGGK